MKWGFPYSCHSLPCHFTPAIIYSCNSTPAKVYPFSFTLANVHPSSFTPAISLSFQFAPANVYSKVSPSTALSHNTNLKSLSIQFPSSNQLCTASVYCDKLSTTRYLGSLLDKMVKLGTCRHSVLGVQPMEFPLHDSRK